MSPEALEIRKRAVSESLLDVSIEPARLEDVDELNDLFERFFRESDYPSRNIVYSRQNVDEWLRRVIEFGIVPHLVARLNGRIIGVVSYDLDNSFSEKPVAVLHTVYVVPEHRRSAIGRMLVGLASDSAKEVDNACAFHAPVASGMEETGALQNLFVKAGFQPIGFIMGRGL
jgi:L-amino acid N-acyltransferase YncA